MVLAQKHLKKRSAAKISMEWMDGHAHFFDVQNPVEALQKMKDTGVIGAVSCGVDGASNQKALLQQKRFPKILASIGLHPETVLLQPETKNRSGILQIKKNISNAAGIGEIGLDFKYAESPEKQKKQARWFEELLALASEFEKPVFVHSRRAVYESLLRLEQFEIKKALIHWFDGTPEQLDRIQKNGWKISVGPAVFSQKKIQRIAQSVSLDSPVLETDCPIPFGAVPSDPSWIPRVGERVAELRGEPVEKIAQKTLQNIQCLLK